MTWAFRVYLPSSSTRTYNELFALNYDAPTARTSLLTIEDSTGDTLQLTLSIFPTPGSTANVDSADSDLFNRDEWNHILVRLDTSNSQGDAQSYGTMWINGVRSSEQINLSDGIGNSDEYDLGIGTRWAGGHTIDLEGYMNNMRMWDRALTEAEIAEDYNSDAELYNCYDKLVADSSSLVNGLVFDSDLEDSNLTEHTGNSTLTASGSPTYTDQGLQVECTS